MKKIFTVAIVFSLLAPAGIAFASFDTNLAYGAKGPAVAQLQTFLISQGLYSGSITGSFFSLTRSAVQQFQKVHSISPASGYFGPLSRTVANALLTAATPKAVTVSTSTTATPQSTQPVQTSTAASSTTQPTSTPTTATTTPTYGSNAAGIAGTWKTNTAGIEIFVPAPPTQPVDYTSTIREIDVVLANPTADAVKNFCTQAKQFPSKAAIPTADVPHPSLYDSLPWCGLLLDDKGLGHYTVIAYDTSFIMPLEDSDSDTTRAFKLTYNKALSVYVPGQIIAYNSGLIIGQYGDTDQLPNFVASMLRTKYQLLDQFYGSFLKPVELIKQLRRQY